MINRYTDQLVDYIEQESIEHAAQHIKDHLQEALIDIIACTIAGSETPVAQIVRSFVIKEYAQGNSTIFLNTERLSPTGATLVNATMANAFDIDDGHRLTKGHPGAVVFPAVLAAAEERNCTGKEFLTALLIGYEVGIRAAIVAHQVRPEYHCTGSWGALGAAAGVARLLGIQGSTIEHALGIAEYQSTYSPMMRCIDHPSMLKDGIAWGSMTGISAAYLAREGFTGIPSLFTFEQAQPLIQELGQVYRVNELYYKPHACCRWAQPAIEAVKAVIAEHQLSVSFIDKLTIYTFTESSRLSKELPQNTEEAQYNLFYPLAAYLTWGEVGPNQVLNELENEDVLRWMSRLEVRVDPILDEAFPAKALSRVEVITKDGQSYVSKNFQARGDFDFPLTKEEKLAKFFWLTEPILGLKKSEELLKTLKNIEDLTSINSLTAQLQA